MPNELSGFTALQKIGKNNTFLTAHQIKDFSACHWYLIHLYLFVFICLLIYLFLYIYLMFIYLFIYFL